MAKDSSTEGNLPSETDAHTREALEDFLKNAPEELRPWARERLKKFDVASGEPAQPSGSPRGGKGDKPDGELSPIFDESAEKSGESAPGIATGAVEAGILEENDLALAELDEVPDEQQRAVRKAHRARKSGKGSRASSPLDRSHEAIKAPSSALHESDTIGASSAANHGNAQAASEDTPVKTTGPAEGDHRKSRMFRTLVIVALTFGIAFGVFMIGSSEPEEAPVAGLPEGHPDISMMEGGDGEASVKAPDHSQRIFELETLLADNPQDWESRLELGVLRMNQGDYAEAESEWLRVLEGTEGRAEAYYNLGFLYVLMTPPQHDKAIAAWDNLFELDPESDLAKDAQRFYDALKEGPPATSPADDDAPRTTTVPTPDEPVTQSDATDGTAGK